MQIRLKNTSRCFIKTCILWVLFIFILFFERKTEGRINELRVILSHVFSLVVFKKKKWKVNNKQIRSWFLKFYEVKKPFKTNTIHLISKYKLSVLGTEVKAHSAHLIKYIPHNTLKEYTRNS